MKAVVRASVTAAAGAPCQGPDVRYVPGEEPTPRLLYRHPVARKVAVAGRPLTPAGVVCPSPVP